jgi:hypothetical protein
MTVFQRPSGSIIVLCSTAALLVATILLAVAVY